jgi:hypothetical protein
LSLRRKKIGGGSPQLLIAKLFFCRRLAPKAKRCYAWSAVENGEPKYTTVLEIPPVDSPESAVKVAIAAKAKEQETETQ